MSIATTSGVPFRFTIGDAYSFLVTDSDYAAPDWTAQLVIRDSAGTVRSYGATADGSNHLFALTNADTSTLKPGPGTVSLVYSDGTSRQSDGWREVFILDDPTKAATPSTAEKIVAELEDSILKLAGKSNVSVSFNGQSFTKRDMNQLNETLTYWKARVIREKAQATETSCRGYRSAKCGGRVPWA